MAGEGRSPGILLSGFIEGLKFFSKFPHYFLGIGPYSEDGELVKLVY